MAQQGRFDPGMGYSMPVDAPAYQSPPFHYRNTRCIAVAFETDPEAVLSALPAPLTLVEPATAVLSFHDYTWSTFGPYREAILSLIAEYRGRRTLYIQQINVDTEPPMLAGREIWGYPKKLAKIELRQERDMLCGSMERPAGMRLAGALVRPEKPAAGGGLPLSTVCSLRVIPSPEAEAERPSCVDLIEVTVNQTVTEAWEGVGSVSFPEASALDRWNHFPVGRVMGASYTVYDMVLPHGKILERL